MASSSDQANLVVLKKIPLFIWNFVSKIPKKLLIIDSKTWREIFLKLDELSLKKIFSKIS